VHEWWGHNEYARERARMLAALGYTALALDMYGDGIRRITRTRPASSPAKCARNLALAKQRFDAAQNVLKKHPTVDGKNIAAIATASVEQSCWKWRARASH